MLCYMTSEAVWWRHWCVYVWMWHAWLHFVQQKVIIRRCRINISSKRQYDEGNIYWNFSSRDFHDYVTFSILVEKRAICTVLSRSRELFSAYTRLARTRIALTLHLPEKEISHYVKRSLFRFIGLMRSTWRFCAASFPQTFERYIGEIGKPTNLCMHIRI